MRDKFNKFMQGRYGVDDLSRFTMGVALVLIILAMFANIFSRTVGSTLDILGVAAIVYAYIRIFSKNFRKKIRMAVPNGHCIPGKCRISDNRTHLLTRGSDDPVPVYGTLPGAVSYGHSSLPDRWSV